jgi:hypothetical protein
VPKTGWSATGAGPRPVDDELDPRGARIINDDVVTSISTVDDVTVGAEIYRQDQFCHVGALDDAEQTASERDLGTGRKDVAAALTAPS